MSLSNFLAHTFRPPFAGFGQQRRLHEIEVVLLSKVQKCQTYHGSMCASLYNYYCAHYTNVSTGIITSNLWEQVLWELLHFHIQSLVHVKQARTRWCSTNESGGQMSDRSSISVEDLPLEEDCMCNLFKFESNATSKTMPTLAHAHHWPLALGIDGIPTGEGIACCDDCTHLHHCHCPPH